MTDLPYHAGKARTKKTSLEKLQSIRRGDDLMVQIERELAAYLSADTSTSTALPFLNPSSVSQLRPEKISQTS